MVRAFFKAVLFGTLAGAALPTTIALIFLASQFAEIQSAQDALRWFSLVLYPMVLVAGFVLLSAVCFGLPLTLILRRLDREQQGLYGLIGSILGAGITICALLAIGLPLEESPSGLVLMAFGVLSGSVTGNVWEREREKTLADQSSINGD